MTDDRHPPVPILSGIHPTLTRMPAERRRVVVSEFLSLDGVMENPSWTFPYWNDDVAAFKTEESKPVEALLLGRHTYEMFAAAWPDSPDEGAPWINALPKYVATTTLAPADFERIGWNARSLGDDVPEAVRALVAEPGGDLLVYGSAELVQTLLEHDRVDELRLLVYPLTLGEGKRLFGAVPATFALAEARALSSGVVAMVYRRRENA